jgi:OmpR family two-component system sensor histidine kinase YxdK
MTGPMLIRYLRSRLGLVLAFYGNTLLILMLTSLVLSYRDIALLEHVPYALMLATAILIVYLSAGFIRWLPFARQVRWLMEADLDALANMPPGGDEDQEEFRGLMARLYGLAMADRTRYQEAHQRHLAFMNLWVHQMKTPVSALSLIAQRAARQEPEEAAAAMAGVDEEAARLADGLELVLNMARLQDFAQDYRIEPVALDGLLVKLVNQRKRQFIRAAIFPEVAMAAEPVQVLTDAKWISFVIDQIIGNALKYGAQSGKAGQKLRLTLKPGLARTGRTVTLTIADQGPGIPPQDLPRVFDAFFTGDNGRRFADATGIGLWLVKRVLDQLGHTIVITSVAGEGTTVTLTFQK